MTTLESLVFRIKSRQFTVAIIGLGYVGLPLVREFARAGFNVLGFDIDEGKVNKLNRGESYISYIFSDTISSLIEGGKFHATSDFSKLAFADAILICVPTPLNHYRDPDLSFVINTTKTISRYLRKGQLTILESTTYPGTTEEEVLPILESSGLKVGRDFFLAYSPEREDPGNKDFATSQIPRVVSGVTPNCLLLAKSLYEQIVSKTVPVSSPKVAEATKLLENIYRSVNIALVNELKIIFERMGIDIWEVIDSASTKPFGFTPFYPGPGLGGHCIPIDPFYLAWKARRYEIPTRFIELAGEINTNMPYYVVSKISEGLNKNSKSIRLASILLLGISYKKDIDDTRESPSLKIMSLLKEQGANVEYNDPYVPSISGFRRYPGLKMKSTSLAEGSIERFDCVVIVTDHSCYNWQEIVNRSQLVIDTRNATRVVMSGGEKIIKA
ncbi:MAG TPA: nucleotide sugar dehydrogenase [Thermodesulfobacteriota bacterium]|nr:nucleotide sugar dehydrogenase [Thermodesulfobacteriota bacterium]